MERWPWPKSNTNMKNECQCGTNEQVSTSLNKFKPAQTQQQKQQQHGAAVKLILWPSGEATGNSSASDVGLLKNNNISDKTSSAVNSASMDQINKKTSRNKMWSKLPLRQIPSSLSAKMGWLGQILVIMIYDIYSPHIFEVHYYLVQTTELRLPVEVYNGYSNLCFVHPIFFVFWFLVF